MYIDILEGGLRLLIEIGDDGDARLLALEDARSAASELPDARRRPSYRLLELQASGMNTQLHRNNKMRGTSPAAFMRYAWQTDERNATGRKLAICLEHDGLRAIVHYQLYDGLPLLRAWTEVVNTGQAPATLEFVSSFCLTGLSGGGELPWDRKSLVHIPHNTWKGELQWRAYTTDQLGLNQYDEFSLKRISYKSNGTWSSGEYLPMGMYENTQNGRVYFWQIEHNGAWYWEMGDIDSALYLTLSGPGEQENHWSKRLLPGESFTTVPAAVGVCKGTEAAFAALTSYRRRIRRPNADNRTLPVVFNDYMNCLFGNATTDKLLPLIDAAAACGCEYFCIDCGWYADGGWWGSVGQWQPSRARFPGGLGEVTDYIRRKGMIPGLWLEIEVIGVMSPMLSQIPDSWFFQRHGMPVKEHDRYQLDFRNPQVRAFADRTIDRLVREFGVGYIKMDYNINAGIGTQLNADSAGDGLLSHNRAYLAWIDAVFARYPELVIENCASGGMRMDYAMLARHSIQSTSDQTDYRKYAVIAASAPTAVCPEQAAVWSYPLPDGDAEETAFNMVNCLLLRVHQSGVLARLSPERLALVREGIALYKRIRPMIPQALPVYPLGVPQSYHAPALVMGLRHESRLLLAVWQMQSDAPIFIPLAARRAELLYPLSLGCDYTLSQEGLTVRLRPYTARLFEVTLREERHA